MRIVIIVNNRKDWPFKVRGIDVVDARSYLTNPEFGTQTGVKLFNLCRSYKYQSIGYYVTLMATARGHRPLPDLTTIQDLKLRTMVRYVSDELDDLIQQTLRPIRSREFTLSVYFGHNLAKRYDRLSVHLFNMVRAPFVRAIFHRPNGKWTLRSIQPIPVGDIPTRHHEFVREKARDYFSGKRARIRTKPAAKFDLAILANPGEEELPSNAAAIEHFVDAAEQTGLAPEIISRDDFARLAEFDALFIRETTHVNHHTYRFARRAATEGLVVMDALKAANLIGDGLYGVDLKQVNGHPVVIEINDNPNVDAGHEDQVLKHELYQRIMRVFLKRIESSKAEVDAA